MIRANLATAFVQSTERQRRVVSDPACDLVFATRSATRLSALATSLAKSPRARADRATEH